MAFAKKTPPVKIKVEIDTYNSLLEFISKNEMNQNGDVREVATKLKEKLLRYSVPTLEEENEFIEIRFFPNEAANMINILLFAVDGVVPSNNYYNVLMEVRSKMKQQFNNNNNE